MNKLTRAAILALASAATIIGTIDFAAARERYPYWRGHPNRHYHGRALAAGAIGLTAGVIIGSTIAAEPRVVYRPRPVYRPGPVIIDEGPVYEGPVDDEAVYEGPIEDTPDRDYAAPRENDLDPDYFPDAPTKHNVVAKGGLEPWSAQWRAYCAERFQSFNQRTGTYRGYDGRDHFCTAG
jgi:hypothetical protein